MKKQIKVECAGTVLPLNLVVEDLSVKDLIEGNATVKSLVNTKEEDRYKCHLMLDAYPEWEDLTLKDIVNSLL